MSEEKTKQVYEIPHDDPSKLAFMVAELTVLMVKMQTVLKNVVKHSGEDRIRTYCDGAVKGSTESVLALMKAMCSEVDGSAPEIQAVLKDMETKGEAVGTMSIEKKTEPVINPKGFSFTAPVSNKVH